MRARLLQAALATTALLGCGAPSPAAPRSAARPFVMRTIATFDSPWAMSFLPGSGVRMTTAALVSEKGGKLWLVSTGSGQRQQVGGVPAARVAGQGGLGDVVAHPDFAGNRRVYLSFVEAGSGGTSGAAVGYGTLVLGKGPPRLDGFHVIWRQSPKVSGNGHFSHRIAFAPDGSLFLSSGERQKMAPAQDLRTNLGKILHLTAEGAPAEGNPFNDRRADSTRDPAIWTYGHRNVLGLAFTRDGNLWATEMGPQGGDELNLIVRGRNYGWPIVSNGSHYGGADIPDHPTRPEFMAPKLWWNPSISPAGLIIYSGDLFPQWKGDAIFGALSGQALLRADINGDAARKADQWNMGARIREVEQGPKGEIYLLEDEGPLVRLDPAPARR